MTEDTFRWIITAGVGIATLCIIVLAVAAIMIYKIMARLQPRIEQITDRVPPLLESVHPIINTVNNVARENAPKISAIASRAMEITTNFKGMSDVSRSQANRFADLGTEFTDRAQAKMARVDAVMDETVDQVQQAGDNVKAAVLKPVREAGAVLAGVRAAVSSLATGRRPTIDHITQDEEMFI